jgi:hypothetical protein
MPIVSQEDKTPGGRHVIRCQVSGHVSGQDALKLLEEARTQAKRNGTKGHLLCNVAPGTDYSPESRRSFTNDFEDSTRKVAAVVSSKIVRAAINFMTRLTTQKTPTRCFDDEASAMVWLDE